MTQLVWSGPEAAAITLLLAHGAGAGMSSPFMQTIAELLADRAVRVARFEFGYMAERTRTGRRRPPPAAERLDSEMLRAVEEVSKARGDGTLAIGGKSMGGRVASHVAGKLHAEGRVSALVCLGYPFHPPKTPERTRVAHLGELKCPTLIVQGERDPFGTCAEVTDYPLSPAIRLHWATDGDHDLGPRGGSGVTRRGNLAAAADAVAAFLAEAVGMHTVR
jgi:hypothetical protein